MKKRVFRYAIVLVCSKENEILVDAKNKKDALKIANKIIRTNENYMDMRIYDIIRLNKHGDII